MSWGSSASVLQLLRPHAATTEAFAPGAYAPQQEKQLRSEVHTPQWRAAHARPNEREPEHSKDGPLSTRNT